MNLIRYASADAFLKDNFNILMEHEAQNNLILGNALRGRSAGSEGYYMASVKRGDCVVLCAIMTPPYNLVLYSRDNKVDRQAASLLADNLIADRVGLPGVLAEKRLSECFTAYYGNATGIDYSPNLSMSVMCAEKVNKMGKTRGELRAAGPDDLFFLPYWECDFERECRVELHPLLQRYELTKSRMESGNLYIWQDGCPVSTAARSRELINGIVVNGVYTPPFYRGRGYASCCVSALTSLLLEKYKFCCLFVDNVNPVSNKIYTNIGYEYICDYQEYKFQRKQL